MVVPGVVMMKGSVNGGGGGGGGGGNGHTTNPHHRPIRNNTISGLGRGCRHKSEYFVNPHVRFPMCMGQTDTDLKNGMSIINLINSRGFLPTCRILHLLLWMASETQEKHITSNEYFIDVGANIGSCSVHMAALGLPVVSFEPVRQHVDTILGSMEINPAFAIDLHFAGVSYQERLIHANFGHGSRNWGASEFHEVSGNDTNYEAELELRSLDRVMGQRKVVLMKIDCEGCEYEALKGAKRLLKRVSMIKIELVQPSYTAGNETVSAKDIIQLLASNNFDLFIDHWNEQHLYFGKRPKDILDIDQIFGSGKFNLPVDLSVLEGAARKILSQPIDPATFDQRQLLKSATDVIAIEKSLSEKMRKKWLGDKAVSAIA
eukprot:scaffold381_cov168-Ochromonas_danica.AAC.43